MKKGLFAFLLTFMLGIFTVSAQVENPGSMVIFSEESGK